MRIARLFSEIEPSFPYRDVTIRRGVEFKDDYDIQAELGRWVIESVDHQMHIDVIVHRANDVFSHSCAWLAPKLIAGRSAIDGRDDREKFKINLE